MSNLLTTSTQNSNYGTLNISGTSNLYDTTITTSTVYPNGGYQYTPYIISSDILSNLSNLNYDICFSDDVDNDLKNNIISINDKLLTFSCNLVEKEKIQPYELIMKMINEKRKFIITIDISDILTIKYTGVKFKSVENNFKFINNSCDFNTLNVKIKYKNIIYDNHKLHITEKRKEKLKKIMEV